MMKNKKNILITGGTGFIGKNLIIKLVKEYNNNYNLFVLTRQKSIFIEKFDKYFFEKINFINADIKDTIKVNISFEIIYHLATDILSDPKRKTKKYTEDMIDGLIMLKKNFVSHETKKFIFLSSGAVYSNKKSKKSKENEVCADYFFQENNHYGTLKIFCEHYLWSVFKNSQTKLFIFRVFSVFGKYQNTDSQFFMAKLINSIINKKDILFNTDCKIFRNYIYVEDLVDQILSLSKIDMKFLILNLGSFDARLDKLAFDLSKKYNLKVKFGNKSHDIRKYYLPNLDNLRNNYKVFDNSKKNFLLKFYETIDWYKNYNEIKLKIKSKY